MLIAEKDNGYCCVCDFDCQKEEKKGVNFLYSSGEQFICLECLLTFINSPSTKNLKEKR